MVYIDDEYYIKADGTGFVGCKKMVAKMSGKENTKVIGYYLTIPKALKGIEEQMAKDYVEETKDEKVPISDVCLKCKEIKNKMKRIRKEIEDDEQ